jgi:hypothetical protein
MALLILGDWIGYKYVTIEKCPIRELQDYINLKLIQDHKCRLSSPKKPSINLVTGQELGYEKEQIYKEFNNKKIDVTDKKNWIVKNNILFLKLGKNKDKEILFMIANSPNINNLKEEIIFDIIKDSLLYFNYSLDW